MLTYSLQVEKETDGRWLAEVPGLPGVMAYGDTEVEAVTNTELLAVRVISERLQHEEADIDPLA